MPNEFVSRQWLIDEYHRRHNGPPGGALRMIEEAPAADVEPVRHGKWVRASGMMPPEAFGVYECSLCGWTQDYHIPVRMRKKTPFCPGCGAKLEGDDDADK